MRHLRATTALIAIALATPLGAQQSATALATDIGSGPEAFASENAILNTAVPFAIGAREARQSLRGAFGWPTYQEGLVEGVYFRFDPDGYARFAPTPRLDRDVFEVICRPRTTTCMGRKGPMALILNARGQLQLELDGAQAGDRFFVAEGVSEIELPADRLMQPLEPQMELLLGAGGDLLRRRGDTEADRIPLTGFAAVAAYLRWVAAAQDYSVLPRGWPVPSVVPAGVGVTQAATWASPMPQPQGYPALGTADPNAAALAGATGNVEVAEVKGELRILRELLLDRARGGDTGQMAGQMQARIPGHTPGHTMTAGAPQGSVAGQIADLQAAAQRIQADLSRLQTGAPGTLQPQAGMPGPGQLSGQDQAQGSQMQEVARTMGLIPNTPQAIPQGIPGYPSELTAPLAGNMPGTMPSTAPAQTLQATAYTPEMTPGTAPGMAPGTATDPAAKTAERLHYLIAEIGLDPKTALMLLQIGETPQQPQTPQTPEETKPLYRDALVAQILAELETDINPQQKTQSIQQTKTNKQQYNTLTKYFKSVWDEANQ